MLRTTVGQIGRAIEKQSPLVQAGILVVALLLFRAVQIAIPAVQELRTESPGLFFVLGLLVIAIALFTLYVIYAVIRSLWHEFRETDGSDSSLEN